MVARYVEGQPKQVRRRVPPRAAGRRLSQLADEAGDTLIGQNVLGRLLMEWREKLKDDTDGALKTVPPLGIPDFLLLGKPIEAVAAKCSGNGQKPQPALF